MARYVTVLWALVVCLGIYAGASPVCGSDPIPGIGPVGEIRKLHGDLQFTEGPAADSQGNVYFTDIPANRIYQRTAGGQLKVFLEPSGHCNGLMLRGDETLLACSMDGRLIQIDVATKAIKPLAEQYLGKRFNAPNDLVIDHHGGVYFTDPHYRAPTPLPQGKTAVYYHAANGKVHEIVSGPKAPNGVILSPDEKMLYVIPSMQKEMFAYPIKGPGQIGEGGVFCSLKQPPNSRGAGSGGDGLTIDTAGNLYITSALGIQVVTPQGKHLGVIEVPERPANVTFGGKDRKTLFITARTALYSVPMEATGHVFPGPAD